MRLQGFAWRGRRLFQQIRVAGCRVAILQANVVCVEAQKSDNANWIFRVEQRHFYVTKLILKMNIYDCCYCYSLVWLFSSSYSAVTLRKCKLSVYSVLLGMFPVRINLPLFSNVVPAIIFVFLSCRPFVAITTLSTGLVGVEVTSVSWLGQLTVGV